MCTASLVSHQHIVAYCGLQCPIVYVCCSMDGFRVVRLEDILPTTDILITASGNTHSHTHSLTEIHGL